MNQVLPVTVYTRSQVYRTQGGMHQSVFCSQCVSHTGDTLRTVQITLPRKMHSQCFMEIPKFDKLVSGLS